MGYYKLSELAEKVTRAKEDLPLQKVNGDTLRIEYFDHEVDWHVEDRDEFFICLHGSAEFSVEANTYDIKEGDLLVIERGKRHRASSSGAVLLSVEPHEKGR